MCNDPRLMIGNNPDGTLRTRRRVIRHADYDACGDGGALSVRDATALARAHYPRLCSYLNASLGHDDAIPIIGSLDVLTCPGFTGEARRFRQAVNAEARLTAMALRKQESHEQ